MAAIGGIHHITAVTAHPQRNADFYCGVLGLRLVKITVNFDDPSSYHLYYGDTLGTPGTLLTFFGWPQAAPGRSGPSQAVSLAFAVPRGALAYWERRLRENRHRVEHAGSRFGEDVLLFRDPEGLALEIVETDRAPIYRLGPGSPIPLKYSIMALRSVTLAVGDPEDTARLLTELGLEREELSAGRLRCRFPLDHQFGAVIDLSAEPARPRGRIGAGAVHHVAFRTPDDRQQEDWRAALAAAGYAVTPIIDRRYFHSIYFREPEGVLLEIATSGPGFMVDERRDELGRHLVLPPWLEPRRAEIEQALPPLRQLQPLGSVYNE